MFTVLFARETLDGVSEEHPPSSRTPRGVSLNRLWSADPAVRGEVHAAVKANAEGRVR